MDVSQVNLSRIEAFQQQQSNAFRSDAQATAAIAAQKAAQQEARTETRQVAAAVQALNQSEYAGPTREITILLDPKTHRPMVRIVDKETGEVVQQIPSEFVLRMAQEAKQRIKDAGKDVGP
jgi:flagellar protein FlaG